MTFKPPTTEEIEAYVRMSTYPEEFSRLEKENKALERENAKLGNENARLREAFGLARSMILAGEKMTPEAKELFELALKK